MDGLIDVSDRLGAWIEAAQAQGRINPRLPAIAVLYTLLPEPATQCWSF